MYTHVYTYSRGLLKLSPTVVSQPWLMTYDLQCSVQCQQPNTLWRGVGARNKKKQNYPCDIHTLHMITVGWYMNVHVPQSGRLSWACRRQWCPWAECTGHSGGLSGRSALAADHRDGSAPPAHCCTVDSLVIQCTVYIYMYNNYVVDCFQTLPVLKPSDGLKTVHTNLEPWQFTTNGYLLLYNVLLLCTCTYMYMF